MVRWHVGRNPSTPPDTLAALAQDPDGTVRDAVGDNPSTPLHVLADMIRVRTAPSPDTFHQHRRAVLEKTFVDGGRLDCLPPCPFCENHCVEDSRYYDPDLLNSLLQNTDDLIRRIEDGLHSR